jgi:two-component system phosphate regulon response regulator PhoB
MGRPKVLIIEDDASLTEVLEYNLKQAGYQVAVARNGADGLAQAQSTAPDIVVLDLMLPLVDGLEVCRRLRSDAVTQNALIIMLTARAEESDQLVGFSMGADDYVTKPFSVKVLLERIKAARRRQVPSENEPSSISSQGIEINRVRHRATAGGRELGLTLSEFRLLEALLRHPGRAFSRTELIDAARGDDAMVLERTIDVHIRSLRHKLGDYADLVETVRGVGYRFREADLSATSR